MVAKTETAISPTDKSSGTRTTTATERKQRERYLQRHDARPPAPRVQVQKKPGNRVDLVPDHPNSAMWSVAFQSAFGTTEPDVATVMTDQLLNALRPNNEAAIETTTANAALATLAGIAPRDEIEAMLVNQMIATHTAAMDMLGRTRRAEWRHSLVDSGNLATKLLRTYAAQLDALQRYRGKASQQKVTVEHVHVHEGGQAIVGNVATEGRGVGASSKTKDRAHAQQLTHAPEPTLPCPDPERDPVPVTRGQG